MGTGKWGFRQYWNSMCPSEHETDVLNLDVGTAFVLDGYFNGLFREAVLTADGAPLLLCFYANASSNLQSIPQPILHGCEYHT